MGFGKHLQSPPYGDLREFFIMRSYEGEVDDKGLPHGEGVATHPDGRSFTGHWQHGKWHGEGTLIYADGSTYDGEWLDGKWHGQGIFAYADGRTIVGAWEDIDSGSVEEGRGRVFKGTGTMTYENGDIFVGDRMNGDWTGQGTFAFVNGDQYVGEWKNNKYHGRGELTLASGEYYDGEWLDGEPHKGEWIKP